MYCTKLCRLKLDTPAVTETPVSTNQWLILNQYHNPVQICLILSHAQIDAVHLCVLCLETLWLSFKPSRHSLMQPCTALPSPIPAPGCTEAESSVEPSRVWWQWHPSHAMNNQWTPSGAYNGGAPLQSLYSLFVPHSLLHHCPSPALSPFTPTSPTRTVLMLHNCSLTFLFLMSLSSSTSASLRPVTPLCTSFTAPEWPMRLPSHGTPHSNSVVQFPGS